jgi:hypothetical protein
VTGRENSPSAHMPAWYRSSSIIGEACEVWAEKIVAPWIQSDRHQIATLMLIYAADDLIPEVFGDSMKKRNPLATNR